MSYTNSNVCYPPVSLPTCKVCKGEGVLYPFVKKECRACQGKNASCSECGGSGYIREIDTTRCGDCLGSGLTARIELVHGSSSP